MTTGCRLSFPSSFILTLAIASWSMAETTAPANLAIVATPSASYVSGDTKLANLNDGNNPRSSRGNPAQAYGNWNRQGTQWVQYDWEQPISTNKIDVYWWADGGGVNVPSASRLLYWNGSEFKPVEGTEGLGLALNQFNTTSFSEVKTTRLRLELDSGQGSTGILEWKVYDSGSSPKFAPSVVAGIDRSVVTGGKTYLNGALKSIKGDTNGTWTKQSGPGNVSFADSNALLTTATFSSPGSYTLKLTGAVDQLTSASTLNVKVVEPPPVDRLEVVYTRPYKVNSPLWNGRVKSLIANWIPHCIDQINRTDIGYGRGDGGIDNFVAAGKVLRGEPLADGEGHRGYVFSNAWVHQTVEAMCIGLMVDAQGDKEILAAQQKFRSTLDDWIPKILAAQEPDGYLQTAFTTNRRIGAPGRGSAGPYSVTNGPFQHWTRRGDHEGYTAGYFIESAINHYTMTGGKDLRLYNAAKKLADCWYSNLGPAPKRTWYDGHQEMEQALVRFGRFVNDMEGGGKGDNYIALAKFLLDCRANGSEYDQSHVPVVQQYEAVGHAVRAVYNYSGMADVAAETHDHDYQSAVMSLWDSMVNKKYYVTGGVGSGETSEGFGPDYSLRNNAYCESCSSCGMIFFQYKMNLAYHDAKYADLYEETMYNALLGSTDLAGQNFFYTNPLTGGNRTAWHNCPCCVGNIARTLLMIPTWSYAKSPNGIYVNLFIGSTVTIDRVAGTDVEMVQNTDYPWNGKVSITVNPKASKNFSVNIRVPNRSVSDLYSSAPQADGMKSISVNGAAINAKIENGYATINRDWKSGDRIDFELPMTVQRIKAVEQIPADRGRVALRYGPLLYNVESADQNIDGVLSASSQLSTEWNANLLGGVMTIKGAYADGSALTAIPNYARLNRGGRSIVWIRDE